MQQRINFRRFVMPLARLAVIAIYFLITAQNSFGQNVYNTGSSITIKGNTVFNIKGSYFHADGDIDNDGDVNITDSLVNNDADFGVFGDPANRPIGGTVTFDGSTNQQISGTGMPVIFYNFRFKNASLSTFRLFRPFEVGGQLIFESGNINLNARTIDLGATGSLSGETNTHRIFGNSGFITATRTLPIGFNGEIANMGFHINAGANNFGETEIRRSHFQTNPFSSNGHINRLYDFNPANPGLDPASSLTVEYFDNETLPGHTLSDYKIFHSYKDGFTWIKEASPAGDNPHLDFDVMAFNVPNIGTSAQGRSLVTVSEANCANGPVVDLGPLSKDICQGSSVVIQSTPGQQIYTWTKDGVVISGETTNKITVTENALYELQVIDGNGCEGKDNITINIRETPVADFQAVNFACHGFASNFTDLSSSVDGTITYAWDFGDPTTTSDISTQAVPTYTYANAGTFNASLTVTSQYGCVSTVKTNTVVVNALPSANFTADQVCRTVATTFSSDGIPGTNYAWDFGGGNTSALPAPQFTFNTAGTHSVTLTATDANTACTQAVTKNVVVNPRPIADFDFASICKPNEIMFTNSSVISSGSLTYTWDFGDGELGSVEDPFKTYQLAGTYDVALTVTSDFGCSETVTKPVVASLPAPIFTGDVETCGTQVSLHANPDGRFDGGTFLWSDNSTNAQFVATQSGNYSVKVTMPGGCITTESVKVTLNTIIAPDLGSEIEACASYTLDAGFYPAGTYEWSTSASAQTITVTQSGVYSVEVIDQNGCIGNASVNVVINPVPVVDIGADQTLCNSETTQLDAGTDGSFYLWSDGSTDRFLQAGATGLYNVKVTNSFGCFASDEVRVTVLPPLKVDLGPDRVICGGVSLLLDAGIINVSYQWGSSSGNSGTSRTLTIANGGKYWISVFSSDGCVASDTIEVNETTNTLNAEFLSASLVKPGDTIQFVNVSFPVPFTSAWNFDNGQTSVLEDPSMIYFTEGDFEVSLMVTNGVCTDVKTKTIQVRLDADGKVAPKVKERGDIISSRAYPNPTRDDVHLEVVLSSEMKVVVRVSSLLGISFFERQIHGENVNEVFDMSDLNPGVYFIVIITRNETRSIRILKQ